MEFVKERLQSSQSASCRNEVLSWGTLLELKAEPRVESWLVLLQLSSNKQVIRVSGREEIFIYKLTLVVNENLSQNPTILLTFQGRDLIHM